MAVCIQKKGKQFLKAFIFFFLNIIYGYMYSLNAEKNINMNK